MGEPALEQPDATGESVGVIELRLGPEGDLVGTLLRPGRPAQTFHGALGVMSAVETWRRGIA